LSGTIGVVPRIVSTSWRLVAVGDERAVETAASSVPLIVLRGYARGRDLSADLATLLTESRQPG
jgi:hypothetical protein